MVTVWFVVRVYRGGSRRIALLRHVKEKKKKKEKRKIPSQLRIFASKKLTSKDCKKKKKKIEKRWLKVKKALEYRPFRRDSSQLRTLVPLITGV